MFRVQSLLLRTPRWMSQRISERCGDSFETPLLNSSPSVRPKVCQASKPLQKVHSTGTAAKVLLKVCESLRRSQASSRRGSHTLVSDMEASNAVPSELAKGLWEISQKEAYCALYHPFVVALAAGSLPMESFGNYIAQDVYYLVAFSEAYGLAIDNTDHQEARDVLRGLQRHVQEELDQVHISALQSFGLELPKSISPNAATTAYTNFLLAVAKGEFKAHEVPGEGDDDELEGSESESRRKRKLAAYTIGALTPCMRLYAFLGQEIKRATSAVLGSNPYAKWVETYASANFENASRESEELLQNLASPFSGETDRKNMRSLYLRAMELEVDFFAAQPVSSESIVPLFRSARAANTHFFLVSDFDLTCTVEDSCPVLARLVLSAGDKTEVPHLEGKWQALGDQYSLEYKELVVRLLPHPQQPSKDFNLQGLRQVLKELSDFEREANARVVGSEFLAGLSREAVKQAGSRVAMREGCRHLLTRVSLEGRSLLQNLEFHILSVCWSRSLIEGTFSSNGLEFANIHCNELRFNNLHVSDGNIDRRIESAVDKEKVLEKILSQAKQKVNQNRDSLLIYVGDSVTDLLCLLRADVGIVIGESISLERMAAAFGIKMLPLYTGLLEREQKSNHGDGENSRSFWRKMDGVLYRVSCWNELNAFLLGS
ncbi:hypothetical protein Mapa_004644 [Marchantia paleacea]|nr:hypothetical protein Mapa_004644 [Marchantia paleacea]